MATPTSNPKSLIDRLYSGYGNGIHFAAPVSSLRTNEAELVRGVLRMLQGFSGSLFYWNQAAECFCVKSGIYVPHLSMSSLHEILNQFIYAATCLQLVANLISKVDKSSRQPPPTLKAFVSSTSAWLKRFWDLALAEEMTMNNTDNATHPTLLGLTNSLSSLCSGAEYLLQIVKGAIPKVYQESHASVPAAEVAIHVLDFLYQKLDEICLVPGGEEEPYQMVLHMYVASLLPYIKGLDSWLFEGILDDPYNEMFFYANRAISIYEAEFWEKSYLWRQVQHYKSDANSLPVSSGIASAQAVNDKKQVGGREAISLSGFLKGKEHIFNSHQACPFFIKDLAKSIVSAGKSLQLMRHIPLTSSAPPNQECKWESEPTRNYSEGKNYGWSFAGLTLSEIFCISLAGLVGHGDHVCKHVWQDEGDNPNIVLSLFQQQKLDMGDANSLKSLSSQKIWCKFLVDTFLHKEMVSERKESIYSSCPTMTEGVSAAVSGSDETSLLDSYTENPILTVCQKDLRKNKAVWNSLNLSQKFWLPALNDESLRKGIFGGQSSPVSAFEGTNYIYGFQFGKSEYNHSQKDRQLLEALFPFPTILPSVQDTLPMSDLLPFQKNSTLPSRVLRWVQDAELRITPFPLVVIQECLTIYIKKQVDYVGQHILSKLMNDWRLMDELAVFRAIYLLGSGDLLQHFLIVIFNKLDKGEALNDDFELNTMLQESIRNSSDHMLLSAPDLLIVSIMRGQGLHSSDESDMTSSASTSRKSRAGSFGIDGLDSLKFTYKVPWPLELIANKEAINKYNQVMQFLLKVKRAKFVLDKVRRWMWKGGKYSTNNSKHHWLVEQKLLHFVDAFHQYVMDRVYHSAWRELCEGMAAAGSLDEVLEVHEAYLLSIQRQCFVVPDKLWALIASRINSILSLALDFYSIHQSLNSGGAVSAIKARCEMEVERIEKQFDDCIAFLLRVLSFKLNVGHFPHLADLVTRINYNYYYMSANGNLMAAPSSEPVTSRLGKSFLGRTD